MSSDAIDTPHIASNNNSNDDDDNHNISVSVNDLKEKGNIAFKSEQYEQAISEYSLALRRCTPTTNGSDKDVHATLLINRAAAYLKLRRYNDAIHDCKNALELNSASTKAYYRCALAQYHIGENRSAYDNLQKLLSMDPKNKDGITLMRDVRQRILDDERNSTPISKVFGAIRDGSVQIVDGLKELARLCIDDRYNAIDLGRRNGMLEMAKYLAILSESDRDSTTAELEIASIALRVVAMASTHHQFVQQYVCLADDDEINSKTSCSSLFNGRHQINFRFLCTLMGSNHRVIAIASIHAIVQILKSAAENEESFAAKLFTTSPTEVPPIFAEINAREVLTGLVTGLSHGDPEVFVTASDALNAFVSDSPQYFLPEKLVDSRYENMDDRKARLRAQKYLRDRAYRHSTWAIEMRILPCLVELLDSENSLMRQRSAVCVGHLFKHITSEESLKDALLRFVNETDTYSGGVSGQSIAHFRKRAALESALFMSSKPELGVWSLDQREGVQQLLVLLSSGDVRCQEVAAEVLCQAASTEGGPPLLAPVVSAGVLENLLQSANQGIRAAVAATMTKLSIKAKAFENEHGSELTSILNSVVGVLKSSPLCKLDSSKSGKVKGEGAKEAAGKGLVSFSKLDHGFKPSPTSSSSGSSSNSLIAAGASPDYASSVADVEGGLAVVSVERAVEVLAALVGKTFVKEELVHGSYRVAAAIGPLVAMEVDPRSTAAYGIAHILAALTVSNHELRAKALAEKDMSQEQYEQLAELQRIKTKDENGNPLEEKKPDADPDTPELVRRRILKIVQANGLPLLLHLMSNNTSSQTKDAASRALRQICVEETVRGQFVQLGGLKTCTAVAIDEEVTKPTRRECAHAIAKALVTTNPTMLTEHVRLGCIAPLLLLCRDTDSSNLQQFESCLALTNLTSCGEVEQDRLVAEKGVHSVHYLMFSDHPMVRRAASEVFCNMPLNDAVLKILRKPDMARLWLGLSEEWSKEFVGEMDNEDEFDPSSIDVSALVRSEPFQTARAAIGTLAVASTDGEVCNALLAENCASTVVALLQSKVGELVHRVLVFALNLVTTRGLPAAKHLLEGGVVPALHVGAKMGNVQLRDLCKEVGMALSEALKSEASSDNIADTNRTTVSSANRTAEPDAGVSLSDSRFEELD